MTKILCALADHAMTFALASCLVMALIIVYSGAPSTP